jgi:hypothetical protein
MSDITTLKREIRQYNTQAFAVYDQLENLSLLPMIAQIHRNVSRNNPVRFDHPFLFPVAYEWRDEGVSIDGFDRLEWTVPLTGYRVDIPYNRIDIGRPETVANLQDAISRIPAAWDRLKVKLALDVFRSDAVCYDGQAFWYASHTHPAGQGTFSNMLAPNWVSTTSPTVTEAIEFLDSAKARLATNLTIQAEVIDASQMDRDLVVIVHNDTHYQMFNRVRTMAVLGTDNEPNRHYGTFALWLDKKPTSGEETYIEVFWAGAGAPRPVIFVLDQEPTTLDVYENSRYGNEYVSIGWKGIFGIKAGYPQAAVQAIPV